MKIAIPFENENIYKHFGHTEKFSFYDVINGEIQNSKKVETNGAKHRAVADFLVSNNIDTVICGDIGHGAKRILESNNIKVYPGIDGSINNAISALLDGTLPENKEATCENHEMHSHHHHDHSCGNVQGQGRGQNHGCGNGQGQGRGQNHGCGNNQGQGRGQNHGCGNSQGQNRGQNHGCGNSQGQNRGQNHGCGNNQSQAKGNSHNCNHNCNTKTSFKKLTLKSHPCSHSNNTHCGNHEQRACN